jgi:type I restriction enzyme S subunit
VKILDVARLVTGHTPARDRPEYWNGGISWLNLTEIRALDGLTCYETELQISAAGVENSSAVIHPAGTICMSRTASVGFVTQMGQPMASSQDFVNWICGPELDPRYLMWALITSRPRILGLCSGSTHKTMYVRDAERLHVLLPPLDEQRRIAAVLDTAHTLRATRRQTLAMLGDVADAIFVKMFGDPIANDRGWTGRRLADVCTKIQIGPFGSLLHKKDYVVGGVPLVNPMHIVDGKIRPNRGHTVSLEKHEGLRPYWLQKNDVVLGRRGEMGRVAIVSDAEAGFLCGSGSLYLRVDSRQATPEYVAAALSGRHGRRQLEKLAQGVTMPNLNSDIVARFPLDVPPILLQRRFSEVVAAHSKTTLRYREHLTALESLFMSLQQRAFRGEL